MSNIFRKHISILFAAIFYGLFFVNGVIFSAEQSTENRISMQKPTTPPLVSTEWLASHIDDRNLVILDIRSDKTPIKFSEGHLPNSAFALYTEFMFDPAPDVPGEILPRANFEKVLRKLGVNNDSLIVIVYPGRIPKDIMCATRVYWTLDYYGVNNVSVLDGGFSKWRSDGRPITTEMKNILPGNFSVTSTKPENLAMLEDVRNAVKNKSPILLDSRSPSDYTGKTKQAFVPVGGHITGSVNYFAPLYLNADLTFKSAQQITFELQNFGISKNNPIITYCNSGMWSSVAWFALKKIARFDNVASFDGAVAEWVNRGKFQLEKDNP